MFEIDLGDDRHFIARERLQGDKPLFGRIKNDEEGRSKVSQWVIRQFADAVRAKLPQHREMVQNELYYAGFHWNDPIANRNNAVRNFCFATVETVHPVLTEMRPRPEAVIRGAYSPETADAINERAQWLMDVTDFDYSAAIADREKLKHGWSVYLLNVRSQDGLCEALPLPGWDYWPDPTATNDDEMDIYFIGRPVQTDFLIEKFSDPKKYEWLFDEMGECKIKADNLTSAGYEALERPYQNQSAGSYSFGLEPESIIGAVSRLETDDPNGPAGEGSVSLVRVDGQERRGYGNTTFVIQCFVRDRTRMAAHYTGDIAEPDPDSAIGAYRYSPSMSPWKRVEPTCESGWRMIQMCADGTILDSAPLDACYGGRNVEVDRDYPQLGRYYGPGELRNIIPINRSINRRITALELALSFETNPILLVDNGSGAELDSRAVEPGDVLRKQRGSEIRWLESPSPASHHFEMVAMEKLDMDQISGVQDVSQGRRPAGIEAASAIRNLQEAAQTRIRGKEIPSFRCKARIVKKMLMASARKAKPDISFKASNGKVLPFSVDSLLYEYDMRWAPGSGTAIGRAQQEEKIMALKQQGLIDTQSALERMGIKGVGEIMPRLAAEMSAMAPAAPPGGGA